jgi:hypothetical protein
MTTPRAGIFKEKREAAQGWCRRALNAFNFLATREIRNQRMRIMMKRTLAILVGVLFVGYATGRGAESKWISFFNGKDLSGWTVRGKAAWSVKDGVLVSIGGMGHIYTDAACSDFETKGMFRVTDQGATPNSGFYFRANPPADDVKTTLDAGRTIRIQTALWPGNPDPARKCRLRVGAASLFIAATTGKIRPGWWR